MTRVTFSFGDRVLEGDVVDSEPAPEFDALGRELLRVQTDTGVYRVPESETDPA